MISLMKMMTLENGHKTSTSLKWHIRRNCIRNGNVINNNNNNKNNKTEHWKNSIPNYNRVVVKTKLTVFFFCCFCCFVFFFLNKPKESEKKSKLIQNEKKKNNTLILSSYSRLKQWWPDQSTALCNWGYKSI